MDSQIPHDVLYGVITALGLAVLTLGGLWVRAHDAHRHWSVERINAHERMLAVLENDFAGIREDLAEIKEILSEHTKHDRKIHEALVRKFGLVVAED